LVSAHNDNRVRAAKIGAAARWGPRRVVRLDELDADTQRLIRALLAQAEERKALEAAREAEAA
jgi:hypothetical protein